MKLEVEFLKITALEAYVETPPLLLPPRFAAESGGVDRADRSNLTFMREKWQNYGREKFSLGNPESRSRAALDYRADDNRFFRAWPRRGCLRVKKNNMGIQQ